MFALAHPCQKILAKLLHRTSPKAKRISKAWIKGSRIKKHWPFWPLFGLDCLANEILANPMTGGTSRVSTESKI